MPAFTLYGSRGSSNTDRVRLTLAEGGFTDYELVLLNLQAGEQKVCTPFLFQTALACADCTSLTLAPVRRKLETSPMG
jgi:hypothetical protein